jgi:hypothetical protein
VFALIHNSRCSAFYRFGNKSAAVRVESRQGEVTAAILNFAGIVLKAAYPGIAIKTFRAGSAGMVNNTHTFPNSGRKKSG